MWTLSAAQQVQVFTNPCGVVTVDATGRIVDVNDMACTLLGVHHEDVVGHWPHEFVASDVDRLPGLGLTPSEVGFEFWRQARTTERVLDGETVYLEFTLQHSDGTPLPVASVVQARWTTDGQFNGFTLGFCSIAEVQRDSAGAPAQELGSAMATLFGKRLRSQSRASLEAAMQALEAGEGGTVVVRVPPVRTDPVEVTFWSHDAAVTIVETV